MCGIAGIFEFKNQRPAETRTLEHMLAILTHRGPDDVGTFCRESVAIGMRRLSVIDLAGGRQPIANEDGTIQVVFNGEIYNYPELRRRLIAKGHIFKTASDTEVIVHLYEEMGEDCVQELQGMFAFAIWDAPRQRLFIARDRLGIKPLYYTEHRGSLVFASEIKAILTHPEIEPSLDMTGFGHFLSLKYVPAPRTMFSRILALPPAHTLTCDRHGMKIRPYWQLSFASHWPQDLVEEDYAQRLETLLRDSVRSHLVSDVPFGAFLSGGVDSSLIVALMHEIVDRPIETFSVGFQGGGSELYNELPYARLVAKRFETTHHEILMRPDDLINLSEKVIWHLDQPIGDNASIANYMLSSLASQRVKMVLTGEGGDELFAGYTHYTAEQIAAWIRYIPKPATSLALNVVHRLPGLGHSKTAFSALCQHDEVARLSYRLQFVNRNLKLSLLTRDSLSQMADPYSKDLLREQLAGTDATHWMSRMLHIDSKLWLADDLLARGDKMSMAASIEARVPLLDHFLVEFAASLPPEMKVRRLVRKYLLKKVARKWLPSAVVDRKKRGFPIPFSLWFRTEARSFLHDLLSPANVKRRGLFNPRQVQELLDEHDAGSADHGYVLWGLLSVELWHRAFLDGSRHPSIELSSGTVLRPTPVALAESAATPGPD